jgi:hypothetical protein
MATSTGRWGGKGAFSTNHAIPLLGTRRAVEGRVRPPVKVLCPKPQRNMGTVGIVGIERKKHMKRSICIRSIGIAKKKLILEKPCRVISMSIEKYEHSCAYSYCRRREG